VPIASQQTPHARAGADPRQQLVFFRRQHRRYLTPVSIRIVPPW
jgi:hypothetical protein